MGGNTGSGDEGTGFCFPCGSKQLRPVVSRHTALA